MDFILASLSNQNHDFILSSANNGNFTYAGVAACASRIHSQIKARISDSSKPVISHISFIGYSFGGLVLRYLIGLLYSTQFFNSIEPLHFITFATPHLGASKPPNESIYNIFYNYASAFFTAKSGSEMMLLDSLQIGKLKNLNMIQVLAHVQLPFWKGLALFKLRICFGNTQNDPLVSHYTACILPMPSCKLFFTQVDPAKYPSIVRIAYDNTHDPLDIEDCKPHSWQLLENILWVPRLFIFCTFLGLRKSFWYFQKTITNFLTHGKITVEYNAWLHAWINANVGLESLQENNAYEDLNILEWTRIHVKSQHPRVNPITVGTCDHYKKSKELLWERRCIGIPKNTREIKKMSMKFCRRYSNTSFIAEFMKSVKKQVNEHPTFQSDVKVLAEKTTEIAESDTMKRAKEAVASSGRGASKVVQGVAYAAETVGKGVGIVMESAPVKVAGKVVSTVGSVANKVVEPILETDTAKKIASGITSIQGEIASSRSSPQYIELRSSSEREKIKAGRKIMAKPAVPQNPNAGAAIVLKKETAWEKSWKLFYEKNPIASGFSKVSKSIEESENPLIESARDFWFRVSSVMDETEEAKCIKAFKLVDSSFRRDQFLADVTEFIIPEVFDGYLPGNLIPLKKWCSERVFAELTASIEIQEKAGLVSACKLLDLSAVDLKKLMFLNEEKSLPVALVTFRTQEILLFKDAKTNEIKLGSEDTIESANYAFAFTKDQCLDPEIPFNQETGSWRIISWSRAGSR